MKEQPESYKKKVSPSQVRRRKRRAQARRKAANLKATSAEDVESSLAKAVKTSATDNEISEEEGSIVKMDIEDGTDAPKDLHDAEEVQNVDAINTLVEEILLLDSEIDVDRKSPSLQLEKIIKQSQLNRDLWEKSISLPS